MKVQKFLDVVIDKKDGIETSGRCLNTYVVPAYVRYGTGGESLSPRR